MFRLSLLVKIQTGEAKALALICANRTIASSKLKSGLVPSLVKKKFSEFISEILIKDADALSL